MPLKQLNMLLIEIFLPKLIADSFHLRLTRVNASGYLILLYHVSCLAFVIKIVYARPVVDKAQLDVNLVTIDTNR